MSETMVNFNVNSLRFSQDGFDSNAGSLLAKTWLSHSSNRHLPSLSKSNHY